MRKKKLVDESWEQKDACTSHKFRICSYRAAQSLVVLRSDSSTGHHPLPLCLRKYRYKTAFESANHCTKLNTMFL